MAWLILGLLLWYDAHLFKRIAPRLRARLGDRGKAYVAIALVVSVVLMVIGYRTANGPVWWGASPMTKGINNLMVLVGFYLFAASGMKTWIATRMRHPQLTGFSLWAAGHLLVNGDAPGVLLFGGLLVWGLAEMVMINAAEPGWVSTPAPFNPRKEVVAVIAGVVAFGVVALLHGWLGPNPFGG